jgi:hypothetical protein
MPVSARKSAGLIQATCLATAVLLGGVGTPGSAAAGEAAKPHAGGSDKDLFVVFSAATAAKAPGMTGDSGVAADVKPSLTTVGERKAAGFQIKYTGTQHYAALLLDATSVPKAFGDPDMPLEPELIVFTCRASKGSALVVRLSDADEVFESERDVAGEEWNEIRLGLPKDMAGWKPVTRGDGKLGPHLHSIAIGLRERNAPTGSLELTSVSLLPSVLEVGLKTKVPGNLFVTGEKPSGQFLLKKGAGELGARIWIEDAFGNVVKELPQVTLGGKEDISLPEDFGYYTIRTKVFGYRPGSAASYAVIPDNRVSGREVNSPFGVCCHWGDYWYQPPAGVVAKRAGIGWIRDGHHQDTTAPGGSYQAIKENGLCCMSITTYCPREEREVLRQDGTYDFSDFLGRRTTYAKAVGAEIDFYDMTNEPVFQWSKVFAGKNDRWIEVFSKHFTPQYEAAMQKADPGSRLLWEGYPEQMETFIRAGGAKSVFAISPHTYWFKAQPEDRGELNGGYARVVELMRKNDLSWPVWIGEMGCTTFLGESQHFKSVTELEQAACLVRACCAHYAAGVEKIFWYDLVEWTAATWHGDPANDAFNCEFHFGIVRKDFSPKPAIAAYANLIAQVKGCRWLGRAKVKRGSEVHIYAFQRPGEKPGLVAWTRKGTSPLALPAGAQVTDIFGKMTVWGGGDLILREVPVYISGYEVETEPVPTYAQLPRLLDATDVKLGVRYGARSPVAAREKHPKTEVADRTPAVKRTVRPAAAAEWNKTLFELLVARVANGKAPSFALESMRQTVRIVRVEGPQLGALFDGSTTVTIEWKRLEALDRLRLAQALFWAGGDEFDIPGNQMVAFFALAAGQEAVARPHLENCGPQAERVLAGFDTVTPAAGAATPATGGPATVPAGASAVSAR